MFYKKLSFLLLGTVAISLLGATYKSTDANLDKAEAQKAFELLNKVRKDPKAYNKEWKVNLNAVKARPALKWNDTLAKVAEAKALDMAKRNYFGHVAPSGYGMNYYINKAGYALDKSWLTEKNANFFESVSAGDVDGEAAITDLIIDEGSPRLGHRNHLLGIDKFYAGLVDIGIGFAQCKEGCAYQTYMSVIIATHKE